jgi:hypothetical protein
MPLTPDWATFFSAELGALAALTGFVVVAISTNLSRILAYSWLPARAGKALIGPVGAVTATSLVLIPEQSAPLLGSEIILVELAMVVTLTVVQARSWRAREDATPTERAMRAVMSVGFGLAFVVRGAVLFAGARAGLFWVAAGDVACLVAVVYSAWVLMIEILRWKRAGTPVRRFLRSTWRHQQPFVCVGFVLPQLICPIGESGTHFHRQTAWESGLFNHS